MAIFKNTMELPRYDATNRFEVINFRFRPRAASRLLAVIEITFLLMAIAVAQDAVPTNPADPQIATALQKISTFAVRAVDAQGHRSLPVMSVPER